MKTFEIEITETMQRIIEVEATSVEQAISIVRQKYNNEEIVLNSCDYVSTQIHNQII